MYSIVITPHKERANKLQRQIDSKGFKKKSIAEQKKIRADLADANSKDRAYWKARGEANKAKAKKRAVRRKTQAYARSKVKHK